MRQWTTLHKYMWLRILQGANAVYETVKGAIISFVTKKAAPLTELKVEFSPVQDLHGYDSPWPAGGGKNKLNLPVATYERFGVTIKVNEDGSVNVSGTATNNVIQSIGTFETGAADYLLNGGPKPYASTFSLVGIVGSTWYSVNSDDGRALPQNSTVDITIYVVNGTDTGNVTIYPMIRLSSVSDATFAPYSNECPIEGWTGFNGWQRGKNLWNPDISSDGQNIDKLTYVGQSGGGYAIYSFPVPANTQMRVKAIKLSSLTSAIFIQSTKNGADYGTAVAITQHGWAHERVLTSNSDGVLYLLTNTSPQQTIQAATESEVEIEVGTQEITEYTTYNPDSRTISVTFPAMGKNLLNPNSLVDGYIRATDGVIVSPSATYQEKTSDFIPIESGGIYRVSMSINNDGTKWIAVALYDQNKTFISRIGGEQGTGTTPAYTVPGNSTTNAHYIRVSFRSYGIAENIQVEKGQYTTAYEPYTNTVYGGNVDLVTGQGDGNMGILEFDGSPDETWNPWSGHPNTYYTSSGRSGGDPQFMMCNRFKWYGVSSSAETMQEGEFCTNGFSGIWNGNISFRIANIANVNDWRVWLAENPIQVAYKITPIPISVDPQIINTLKGDNTMWANTNGDIEATYRSN